MGATVWGSMEVAVVLPLRLSLAPLLPLRLAEEKDKVPCIKPPEFVERFSLADLCGAMTVEGCGRNWIGRGMLKLDLKVLDLTFEQSRHVI